MPVPGKYFLKQQNNELNELSVCFFKCLFFLKISPNCKTLFYKTFSKNLACSALKVLKLFILACLLCFALKVSKTFHTCLLALLCFTLKVSKTFHTCLLLKVYKTFHKSLTCLLYLALKVYKTFHKCGSLGFNRLL